MLSRNPKVGSSPKERFIHFDFMVYKDSRKIKRDETLFETRAKLLDLCQDF